MVTDTAPARPSLSRSLAAGLGAGAVAAVAASLVSLLLQSPDRVLINSASVSIVVLLAGLLTGLVYRTGVGPARAIRNVAIWLVGAFVVVSAVALAVEAAPGHPLLHVATFCIPLAAIALSVLGLLTPILVRPVLRPLWVGPLAGIAALTIGFALAGHAGGTGGKLALPRTAASSSAPRAGDGLLRANDVAGRAFAVDASQSKASWTVREKLANLPAPDDAVGTTSQVAGTIFLDGRPSTVTVDMRSFKSDEPTRDAHLLRDPGLANYAPAEFTVSQLDLPSSYKPGDTITRQVQGTMKLNNVEKPMTFAVEARLENNTLFVHGVTDFKFEDFNVPMPTFSRVLSIDDKIHAEVLLVAKPQP